MDSSFLTILFYILIIVVFLSSLFKKKPQGTQEKQAPNEPGSSGNNPYYGNGGGYNNPVNRNTNNSTAGGDEHNEILDEIENLFNKGTRSPDMQEKKPEVIVERKQTKIETYTREAQGEYQSEVPEEYSKWPGSGMGQTVQTAAKEFGKVEKDLKQIDSKIEEEARLFEQLLNKQEEENYFMKNFREKFKEPQTLREYIVFNEILRKPKALRR